MNKCNCWEEKYQIIGWYDAQTPMLSNKPIQICNGTKECEECSCDGDESKCNFYPEKRKGNKCTYFSKGMCESSYIFSKNCSCNGNKSQCNFYESFRKENKSMNTAEMWIKAQEDGYCYEAINYNERQEVVLYQKDKGFFDEDGFGIDIHTWAYLDDLMNEQWRLRTMTKSEAEIKFNIKIVDD